MMGVYAGTSPRQYERVIELILGEMKTLLKDRITREEFEQGREQLKGSYTRDGGHLVHYVGHRQEQDPSERSSARRRSSKD